MTPPITKSLMASRPLYDPRPETFVARDIVQQGDLRRVRLSDFVVIALQLNIQNGHIRKGDVDMFENVYVRSAKPRSTRVHEGQASIAPDGTVMSMNGVPYPGSSQKPAGKWTVENVKDCPGYKDWLARLVQTEDEMVAQGFLPSTKNGPLPSEEALATANAYSPKSQPPKNTRKEKDPVECDVIQVADNLINRTVDILGQFTTHVRSQAIDYDTQQELFKIMRGRIADVFPDEDIDLSSEESSVEYEGENEDDGQGDLAELTSRPTMLDAQHSSLVAQGGSVGRKRLPQHPAGEDVRPRALTKKRKKSRKQEDWEHQLLEEEADKTGEPLVYPDDSGDEDYVPTSS